MLMPVMLGCTSVLCPAGVLEALFSLPLKQRLVALGGAPAAAGEAPAEKVREGRVFQVVGRQGQHLVDFWFLSV
jgi:hypothetical protein